MSAVDNKSEYFIFVSLFLMLWSVSRAVKALIKGMNSAYRVCESRSFIKIMYISVLFTLALIALLFISIILLIYGEKIGYVIFSFIRLDYIFIPVWNVTRYSIGLLTTIFIFVLMYKYTPNKKVKIKEVIIGSVFSTFAWFFVSYFYSYYTNNLANYEAIYGSIAEIIVLITWIYFSSWVIVIGYEINARIFIKKESLESIEKIIKKK
jgi:membrane protein